MLAGLSPAGIGFTVYYYTKIIRKNTSSKKLEFPGSFSFPTVQELVQVCLPNSKWCFLTKWWFVSISWGQSPSHAFPTQGPAQTFPMTTTISHLGSRKGLAGDKHQGVTGCLPPGVETVDLKNTLTLFWAQNSHPEYVLGQSQFLNQTIWRVIATLLWGYSTLLHSWLAWLPSSLVLRRHALFNWVTFPNCLCNSLTPFSCGIWWTTKTRDRPYFSLLQVNWATLLAPWEIPWEASLSIRKKKISAPFIHWHLRYQQELMKYPVPEK